MSGDLEDVAGLLRERGLRVTAPGSPCSHVIQRMDGHPDADAVRAAVADRLGSVSTQAVYDTLHSPHRRPACCAASSRPGTRRATRRRVGDNHHHLVCRACGATRDVDCAAGHAPCLALREHAGFVIDEAEVIFWGLCADCRHHRDTARPKGTE